MKLRTLIKLAAIDNRRLAEHSRNWLNRRRELKANSNITGDPVSLALHWHGQRKKFLGAGLILAATLSAIIFAGVTPTDGNIAAEVLGIFLPVMAAASAIVGIAYAIIGRTTLPSETKMFLEAISLLEKSIGRRDARANIITEDPLGLFPKNPEWDNPGHLCMNAKKVLSAQAREIRILQEKREAVPWRIGQVDEVIEAKKNIFGHNHFVLRLLLAIPPEHKHYYDQR
jgi:hypothetical protein